MIDWVGLEQEMLEIAYSCLGVGILIGIGIGMLIISFLDRMK